MELDPKIWLPHFHFVMQTIALSYPRRPNDTSKKKYYDFIQNIALLFPAYPLGNEFLKLLDTFPVTPYLSSRLSFMKWSHFIENRLNKLIGNPEVDFYDSLENYYDKYKPEELLDEDTKKVKRKYAHFVAIATFILAAAYVYNK